MIVAAQIIVTSSTAQTGASERICILGNYESIIHY